MGSSISGSAVSTDSPLTAEQQLVVDQPPDACVLVTAGPGAGKTHTLVRRLDALVAGGLVPGEILVLSFSRAAVRDLRRRLAVHGAAARHVRAQTFDSWALELLTSLEPAEDWRTQPFDGRIERAVDVITSGRADTWLDDLLHVVVDEVQDLVGTRRRMVHALLARFQCGFTVVGDPAQSIYGFQVEDPAERHVETNRFFSELREEFEEELVELSLTENFRVRDKAAELALSFSDSLRVSDVDPVIFGQLRGVLRGSEPFGHLDDEFARAALDQDETTTAVLTRTNGQAMLIAEELHRAGIRHRLQRSVRDKVVPAWIGRLFMLNEASFIARESFDSRLDGALPSPDDNLDMMWSWLIRAVGSGRNDRVVDLRKLRRVIVDGRLPDELVDQQQASVLVSSYHRAKGLEFDRVIVADPGNGVFELDQAEEARMLYVAMTRARDEVMWIDTPGDYRVRKDKRIDRWARYAWKGRTTLGLEVRGRDVSSEEPPGRLGFEARGAALQRYLASETRSGDEVVLERLPRGDVADRQSPQYVVKHCDRPVATVSEHFRRALYLFQRSTGQRDPWWPQRITGVRIDAVETVVGSEAAGIEAGLGPHGVWLIPRLSGLGTFQYSRHSGGEV